MMVIFVVCSWVFFFFSLRVLDISDARLYLSTTTDFSVWNRCVKIGSLVVVHKSLELSVLKSILI